MKIRLRVGSVAAIAVVVAFVAVACGGSSSTAPSAPRTLTHDCSPICGGARFCKYPLGPGACPTQGRDAGFCEEGCPGCPALPPPSCPALPDACGGTPSCDCLLTVCPGGCGTTKALNGSCSVNADGDWVISCVSC